MSPPDDSEALASPAAHTSHAIDTSALVALSGRRRLELPRACCEHVAVPVAVRAEVVDQSGGWVEATDAQAKILRGE